MGTAPRGGDLTQMTHSITQQPPDTRTWQNSVRTLLHTVAQLEEQQVGGNPSHPSVGTNQIDRENVRRGNKKGWGMCAERGKSQKGLSGEFLRLAGHWGGTVHSLWFGHTVFS